MNLSARDEQDAVDLIAHNFVQARARQAEGIHPPEGWIGPDLVDRAAEAAIAGMAHRLAVRHNRRLLAWLLRRFYDQLRARTN